MRAFMHLGLPVVLSNNVLSAKGENTSAFENAYLHITALHAYGAILRKTLILALLSLLSFTKNRNDSAKQWPPTHSSLKC